MYVDVEYVCTLSRSIYPTTRKRLLMKLCVLDSDLS